MVPNFLWFFIFIYDNDRFCLKVLFLILSLCSFNSLFVCRPELPAESKGSFTNSPSRLPWTATLLLSSHTNTRLVLICCGGRPAPPPKLRLKAKRASQRSAPTTALRGPVRSERPLQPPLPQQSPCPRRRADGTIPTQMEGSSLKRPKVRAHLFLKADQ